MKAAAERAAAASKEAEAKAAAELAAKAAKAAAAAEREAAAGKAEARKPIAVPTNAGLAIADTIPLEGLPLVSSVCTAARSVLVCLKAASTVVADALVMGWRVVGVLELLQLMTQNVSRMQAAGGIASVESCMSELAALLGDVEEVVVTYGKTGWLRHALKIRKHTKQLSELDSEITRCLEMLVKCYRLARHTEVQGILAAREYPVEAEVERQINQRQEAGQSIEPEALEADPEVMRGVVVASGVSAKEFGLELSAHDLKLDEISKLVEQMNQLQTSQEQHEPSTSPSSMKGAFRYASAARAGRALILSVHKKREHGAKEERENAKKSLELMGYDVTMVVDPTKERCEKEVRKFRDASWSGHASSVVAIMAHGCDKGGFTYFSAADSMQVKIPSLVGMLSPENCPDLKGKPKIWIVQACRNGGDQMVQTDDIQDDITMESAILGAEHDNLITYATSPGHSAYRGIFWRAVLDIMSGDPVNHAKMAWMDICGQANHSLAVKGNTSMEIKTYLRDNLISPALLGGVA